jgi:hypothetical protein
MWWRRKEHREEDLDRELRSHLDLEAEEQGDRFAAKRAFKDSFFRNVNQRLESDRVAAAYQELRSDRGDERGESQSNGPR